MIRLCAATSAALSARTVPYLRTVDESCAQRGDGFIVFFIGATLNEKPPETLERIMQRHCVIVTWGQLKNSLLPVKFVQDFQHRGSDALRDAFEGHQFA